MKGFVKVIISGAVILAVGVVILLVALGVHGWQLDDDYDMKSYECTEENTILDIDFSAGTLEINYYDGEKIKIEYPENNVLTASITESNGKLSYTTTTKLKWNLFNWFQKIPTAKIWIPQADIVDIDLDMNAGVIKLAGGEFGDFCIKMNAGALQMDNIICKKLSVDMNAGAINMKDVVSAEAVNIDLAAGALSIQSLDCPTLDGDISAGGVNIARLQTSSVDFSISAGAVKLGMKGAKSDYNISIEKSAGSCNVSNQFGDKDLRIKANISAGSLNVSFEA